MNNSALSLISLFLCVSLTRCLLSRPRQLVPRVLLSVPYGKFYRSMGNRPRLHTVWTSAARDAAKLEPYGQPQARTTSTDGFCLIIKSHIIRRVEPPTGQISNVLANQQISSVQESKDLFSYLSHHGERSNEPVPICDHSRKHFDWQPCEPTDWRIKPRRPRPVPVEHGQGKRM